MLRVEAYDTALPSRTRAYYTTNTVNFAKQFFNTWNYIITSKMNIN